MRQLYQCQKAHVLRDKIYCAAGHSFPWSKDGTLALHQLKDGKPLELTICQECLDYAHMGGQVEESDRGW